MKNESSTEDQLIRHQVQLALAANRTPGYHYPGYLLGCHWPRIGKADLDAVLPGGPQGRNVDGTANLAGFCILLDVALATAARLEVERGARQATVHLHAQFTGVPLRGDLRAHARLDGYTIGAAARQSMVHGTVYAGDAPVCHASGTFIQLPPPPGVTLAPLPWQRQSGESASPLDPKEFTTDERAIMKACNAALRRADQQHAFIEHLWGALPVPTGTGSRCTVKIGPQHANLHRARAGWAAVGACRHHRPRSGAAAPPALRHLGLVYQPRAGPGAENNVTTVPRRPQFRRGAHRDQERGWVARAGGGKPSRCLMKRDMMF